MKVSDKIKAYHRGIKDWQNGKSERECPYVTDERRHAWREGYSYALMRQQDPRRGLNMPATESLQRTRWVASADEGREMTNRATRPDRWSRYSRLERRQK
jgi:ribosome modulation factor